MQTTSDNKIPTERAFGLLEMLDKSEIPQVAKCCTQLSRQVAVHKLTADHRAREKEGSGRGGGKQQLSPRAFGHTRALDLQRLQRSMVRPSENFGMLEVSEASRL